MKSAKIAELKNNLSRYLDYVKAGGTVMVLERDRPIAQIVALSRSRVPRRGTDDGRLDRLERRGVLRRGSGGLPEWLGKRRPPRLRGSVLRDLWAERASGW
jgi:antitoxin (DNA-binding transcriptional repressor) of toxin-antitoxin stability system